MSFKIQIPPVPRLSPDLVKVEEWLNQLRGLMQIWFNKERSLGTYLTYDSSDRKTIDFTTLVTDIATYLNDNSLIYHSQLHGLAGDDHIQYVITNPQSSPRNTISPAENVVALTLNGEPVGVGNTMEVYDNASALTAYIQADGLYKDV